MSTRPNSVALPGTGTVEEVLEHGRVRKLMPTWTTIEQEFGEQAVQRKKVNLDMETREGRRNRRVWNDLMQPWRRAESERGSKVQAQIARSWMRNRRGGLVQVPEQLEQQSAERHGLKPVWRRRGVAVEFDRFGRLPNGHTHLGEPWPHQLETCPGCQREQAR